MSNTINDQWVQQMQEVHAELFPHVLDDDLPDHFDNWLAGQEVPEPIEPDYPDDTFFLSDNDNGAQK